MTISMCAYTFNRSTGFMQLNYMFSRTYLFVIKRIFCSSFLFLSVPFAYVDENFESIKLCWCQFQYLQILFLFTDTTKNSLIDLINDHISKMTCFILIFIRRIAFRNTSTSMFHLDVPFFVQSIVVKRRGSIRFDGYRRKWKIGFWDRTVLHSEWSDSKKQYWLMDSYWLWATASKYTFPSIHIFIWHNPLDRSSCVLYVVWSI